MTLRRLKLGGPIYPDGTTFDLSREVVRTSDNKLASADLDRRLAALSNRGSSRRSTATSRVVMAARPIHRCRPYHGPIESSLRSWS